MSPKRSTYEGIETFRKVISMSQLISENDSEWGEYAGFNLEIAEDLVLIDFLIANKFVPEKVIPLLELYRKYLNRQRKAYFAVICSEISKLGFILGKKDDTIKATK